MEDFLKKTRKQLEDLELENMLKDFDLSKFDVDALKEIDFKKGTEGVRDQLERLDVRKREEEAANEGFLGGVLLGAVIGAILALIFAPKSGSETREMAVAKANDLTHKATEMVGKSDDQEPVKATDSTFGTEPAIERDFGQQSSKTI